MKLIVSTLTHAEVGIVAQHVERSEFALSEDDLVGIFSNQLGREIDMTEYEIDQREHDV